MIVIGYRVLSPWSQILQNSCSVCAWQLTSFWKLYMQAVAIHTPVDLEKLIHTPLVT